LRVQSTSAAGPDEINGDLPMPAPWRIRYIARNVWRNVRTAAHPVALQKWVLPRQALADPNMGTASPARVLAEAFIIHELPNITAARRIRVLDIGCGSGRMSDLLGKAGFTGHYVGVDLQNRFAGARWQGGAFTTEFIEGDAHSLDLPRGFDLIISNSALEHIPDDSRLIARLQTLLAPDGLQVHLVPSTWALFLYLWHGYRQYGRAAIAARFPGSLLQIYKLGGGACFLVHFMLITVPEMLFRQSLRKRMPGLYAAVLRGALRVDPLVPFMPSGYAVICRVGGKLRG
jgi:2-polyprenyl-3-methyl-5-hydroxy-6-metoxy-1,4-benzoquinol methylase